LASAARWCCARHPAEQFMEQASPSTGFATQIAWGGAAGALERAVEAIAARIAQRSFCCSEPRPGGPRRTSDERAPAAPGTRSRNSRKTSPHVIFSWRSPLAGAAVGILPISLFPRRPALPAQCGTAVGRGLY
jgi:hypothetical protein